MKALFRKPGKVDNKAKRFAMGAASAAFKDQNLSIEMKTSIRLAYYLFGKLDRQIIAAMEINLNLNADHRRNIQRFIGEISNHSPNLQEITKPHIGSHHHRRYKIFGDLCKIASSHQRYEMAFIRRVISIGQALDISEDEIFRMIKQVGLAE